jgi:hypothetical protein
MGLEVFAMNRMDKTRDTSNIAKGRYQPKL